MFGSLGPPPRILTADGDYVSGRMMHYLHYWSDAWLLQERCRDRGARIFSSRGYIEAWRG